MDSGQWADERGQWTVDSGQMRGGQCTVDRVERTVNSGQWADERMREERGTVGR